MMTFRRSCTKQVYFNTLSNAERDRFTLKPASCGGDAYAMDRSEFSEYENLWQSIRQLEINEYHVLRTRYVSKKQIKIHKSLEALN